MTKSRLNSMLLASSDPERLHAWYAAAFEPEQDTKTNGYRLLTFGGFTILIDRRDDVTGSNPQPGRMILNFDVADARAVARRLDDMGVTWKAELEEREPGLFATAIDPDGNYVQIIQLHPGSRAGLGPAETERWPRRRRTAGSRSTTSRRRASSTPVCSASTCPRPTDSSRCICPAGETCSCTRSRTTCRRRSRS